MKKFLCLLMVLVLCLSIAVPAFAETGFVPSITYKPNPEIVPVQGEDGEEYIGFIRDEEGEIKDGVHADCLTITPVAYVWDPTIELPEEVEELLTNVYEKLNDKTMVLPLEKFNLDLDMDDMVIRDLFDARWACDEHREMVEKDGVTFEITFDLGVVASAHIYAMTYDELTNDWTPVVKTVNNGDGTVTCTFEHLCAIAFAMPLAEQSTPVDVPHTFNFFPWILILILALIAIIVIVLISRKKKTAK